MNEILYAFFYLAVLGLVGGCVAYLYVNWQSEISDRPPAPSLPPDVIKKAEELSGTYNLHELESILTDLAAIGAWGMVVEVELAVAGDVVQMTTDRGEAELYESSLDPVDIDRFRRSAANAGIEIQPSGTVEGQYSARITGTWASIAETITRILRSRYGAVDGEEIQVRIF